MQPCSGAPRSSTHRRCSGIPALSCDVCVCVSGLPASSQGSPSHTLLSLLVPVTLLKRAVLLQMSNITVTYRDGRVAQLEQVYIRGSKIRFLILPDMLKNAPMLKSMKNKNQGSGAGRGKAAILKAQGRCCGRGAVTGGRVVVF